MLIIFHCYISWEINMFRMLFQGHLNDGDMDFE
jgi:hypothetical protein